MSLESWGPTTCSAPHNIIALTLFCRLDSPFLHRCRLMQACSRQTPPSELAQANRLFSAPQHPASLGPSPASRGHRHSARMRTVCLASSPKKEPPTIKTSSPRLPAIHRNRNLSPSLLLLLVLQPKPQNLGPPQPLVKVREASTTDPFLLPPWARHPLPSGHLQLQDPPGGPSPPDRKPLELTALQPVEPGDSSLPAARLKLRAKVTPLQPKRRRRRRKAQAIVIVGVTRNMLPQSARVRTP